MSSSLSSALVQNARVEIEEKRPYLPIYLLMIYSSPKVAGPGRSAESFPKGALGDEFLKGWVFRWVAAQTAWSLLGSVFGTRPPLSKMEVSLAKELIQARGSQFLSLFRVAEFADFSHLSAGFPEEVMIREKANVDSLICSSSQSGTQALSESDVKKELRREILSSLRKRATHALPILLLLAGGFFAATVFYRVMKSLAL